MSILDLINDVKLFPYRRRDKDKHFYYARYPNGDFFQGSGGDEIIFFKTKKGLLKNIRYHANNIFTYLRNDLDADIDTEEEVYTKLLEILQINEL